MSYFVPMCLPRMISDKSPSGKSRNARSRQSYHATCLNFGEGKIPMPSDLTFPWPHGIYDKQGLNPERVVLCLT